MISKVLVVAALVCGILAIFVSKGAFGVTDVQFAGAGVVLLAVAALL
jgi:hypothetical protein